MGLADIVRSGVAIAKGLTSEVQADVVHEPFYQQDADGKPTYGALVETGGLLEWHDSVTRPAIVEYETKVIRTIDGHERMSTATLTLLSNVTVTLKDRFTLPSGKTCPVLKIGGLADPAGTGVFLTQVWLG